MYTFLKQYDNIFVVCPLCVPNSTQTLSLKSLKNSHTSDLNLFDVVAGFVCLSSPILSSKNSIVGFSK